MITITQQQCGHLHAGTLFMLMLAKVIPQPSGGDSAVIVCACGKVGARIDHTPEFPQESNR